MDFPQSMVVLMGWLCVSSFPGGFSTPLEPMRPMEVEVKGPRAESSVLTLRYEGGRVAEVRLEQGGPPTLLDGTLVCTDLCSAGLGGSPCGPACGVNLSKIITKIWRTNLHTKPNNISNDKPDKINGRPRFEVCPILCDNNLGQPICGCNQSKHHEVNWDSVCSSFCSHGSYTLQGCPECPASSGDDETFSKSESIDNYGSMEDIWVEWCNYQCHKGEGGAACNCDLAPLKMNQII